MALRIRTLLIQAVTAKGVRGVRLNFSDGLNVIRADNSMGKSTCMNGIAYALGLDHMITTSHAPFLPNALTDHLELGEESETVITSEVFLEIENDKTQILTLRRPIKATKESRQLINVWDGPSLSQPAGTYKQTDYYVRTSGAATEAHGFHQMLTQFVGWSLPDVPRYNGDDVPLYVEAIFPLLFVEQKRGWASIRGRFPTHFGIRDVWKRSLEFLLDLDAYDLAVQRQTVRNGIDATRAAWKQNIDAVEALARVFGTVARYVPDAPTPSWPPQITPRLAIPAGADLEDVRETLKRDKERLDRLAEAEVPVVADVADQRQADLQAAERDVAELQFQATTLVTTIEQETAELNATRTRLDDLRAEVRRIKDTLKLVNLGSHHAIEALEGVCPTCHQEIRDATLHGATTDTMPLDDNLKFVGEQIAVFELVESESRSRANNTRALLNATNRRIAEVRARIRALRATLVSDPRLPSRADVEERVALDTRVRELTRLLDAFEPLLTRFAELSASWAALQARRAELGDAGVSAEDEAKLSTLENSFKQQLREYDFKSEQPAKIIISRNTYQPEADGFDVEADASASDMIRVIWAYMLGLLEVARSAETNHLGLLMFDEPRQQSTAKESFQNLLIRATRAHKHNQQIIFATSEELSTVTEALKDRPHTLRVFDGKVLQPV